MCVCVCVCAYKDSEMGKMHAPLCGEATDPEEGEIGVVSACCWECMCVLCVCVCVVSVA
jgi:hypothetical protein